VMRWLLWRELAVMTRTRALWTVMRLQQAVLAAFIVVWGDGAPTMTGSVAEQFSSLHGGLLLFLLPWMAARLVGDGRTMAMIAAMGACTPAQVVAAKFLALMLTLFAVAISVLPLKILAFRVSDVEVWRVVLDLPLIIALCAAAAALATVSVVTGLSRFTAWIVGTAAVLLGVGVVAPPQAPVVLLTAALVMVGVGAIHANHRLAYLPIGRSR
jgi:hypothetical protein